MITGSGWMRRYESERTLLAQVQNKDETGVVKEKKKKLEMGTKSALYTCCTRRQVREAVNGFALYALYTTGKEMKDSSHARDRDSENNPSSFLTQP
jgi:hypothetical protein